MTESDVDKETLHEELGQIKQAMGLTEAHPYWIRSWLVEGVTVGILFPLLQFGLRDGFGPWLITLIVGIFALYLFVDWRTRTASVQPTTGVPSWTTWHVIVFVGLGALIVGLGSIFDQLNASDTAIFTLVLAGTVLGVGYMFMGQLLKAYDIRRADQFAFYIGGAWILVLSAGIPHVALFAGWEYAVLGIGIAVHGIVTSFVLARL